MRLHSIAVAALALAGCAHDQNMTVATVHQPVVATREWTLPLAADALGLAAGEAARLDGWLSGLELAAGDRIATDAPAGPARDAIVRAAGARGVLLAADPPAGPAAPGAWRVTVARSAAAMPGCPDWTQGQRPASAPAAGRNYGCAVNGTLAAMLDDPLDLVRGRSAGGTVDPRVSVKAIGAWRDAKTAVGVALKAESSKAGGSN